MLKEMLGFVLIALGAALMLAGSALLPDADAEGAPVPRVGAGAPAPVESGVGPRAAVAPGPPGDSAALERGRLVRQEEGD